LLEIGTTLCCVCLELYKKFQHATVIGAMVTIE